MKFVLIVAAVLIAIGIYVFYLWHTLARSIEASKPLIAEAVAFEQHPAHPTEKILVAGDSTGVGVGASSNQDSIAGRIGRDFPDADITNISHSGDRLADLEKILQAHNGSGYDVVLLQIGANDITGRTPYADTRAELEHVLDRASMLGVKIVVMTAGNVGLSPAFKWPLSLYIEARTKSVRSIFLDEISKHQNASYVDLFKEAKDEIFNTDIPRYYAPDRFHPSGEGYGEWYAKLKPSL